MTIALALLRLRPTPPFVPAAPFPVLPASRNTQTPVRRRGMSDVTISRAVTIPFSIVAAAWWDGVYFPGKASSIDWSARPRSSFSRADLLVGGPQGVGLGMRSGL